MIHVVTVLAGDSRYARIGQMHAIEVARLFGARLRVALIWEPEHASEAAASGDSWEERAEAEARRIMLEAGNPDIEVETSVRGGGLHKGLLAEARETDLLVLGLPECPTGDEPVCRAIRHDELALLYNAESLISIVCRDPEPIRRVLVDYRGGAEGKAALRLAGEVASRVGAAVSVLIVDQARDTTAMLATSAKRYLAGFDIADITTVERLGQPGSQTDVLEVAEDTGADLVVVDGARHGVLEWLRGRAATRPEEISTTLQKTVLVAR